MKNNYDTLGKGYGIFDYDGTGMLEIQKLDDDGRFQNDEEAVAQAVKDGVLLIPVEELPANFDRKYLGWIDTPENRQAIQDYCDNYLFLTWYDIFEKADGAGFGEYELKAKDNARYEVVLLAEELGLPNPEEVEIPEEAIEMICEELLIAFSNDGKITSYKIPDEENLRKMEEALEVPKEK